VTSPAPVGRTAARRLGQTHRRDQAELQAKVGRDLARLIAGLPSLNDQALDRYVTRAHTIVTDGQTDAASVAARYAAMLNRSSNYPDRDALIAELEQRGVLLRKDHGSLFGPIIRARQILADTSDLGEAKAAGAARSQLLSSNHLHQAVRVGVAVGAAAAGLAVIGWRKEIGPGACAECAGYEGDVYADPDDVPWHPHDECSIAPVTE
jgi:hypothetical protein